MPVHILFSYTTQDGNRVPLPANYPDNITLASDVDSDQLTDEMVMAYLFLWIARHIQMNGTSDEILYEELKGIFISWDAICDGEDIMMH